MRRLTAYLILLLAALTACGQSVNQTIALSAPPPIPTHVGAISDTTSLADALRASGLTVAREGRVSLSFLHASGTILRVNDERMQVYEYANADAAHADAARFSTDGATFNSDEGVTLVNWIATPHLFQAERLLVVYVGDHSPTLAWLTGLLGQQFAGGANPYHALAEKWISRN